MKNIIYTVLMVINSLSLAYMIGITITYFFAVALLRQGAQ